FLLSLQSAAPGGKGCACACAGEKSFFLSGHNTVAKHAPASLSVRPSSFNPQKTKYNHPLWARMCPARQLSSLRKAASSEFISDITRNGLVELVAVLALT